MAGRSGAARRRRPSDAAAVAVGGALLAAAWQAAREGDVGGTEEIAFRRVNELPGPLAPVWPVMQLGNLGAVPVLTVAAELITHDRVLAAKIAAAGTAGYVGSKVIKRAVQRGRPGDLVDGARLREQARGLGFVSGHSAEAAAMATVVAAHLPRHRWIPRTLAAVVGLSRVYVGAHLPHDVVGGAGLGLALGGIVNLVAGVPDHRAPGAST